MHANPTPNATVFDPALGAWIVCRHAEVMTALHDPRLTVDGAHDGPTAAAQAAAHAAMRTATARALSRAQLRAWRPVLATTAQGHVRALPADVPVDLVASFARPWALEVAATVLGLSTADAEGLAGHARVVFDAAAAATDLVVAPAVAATAADLARELQMAARWPDVQAFVALSQTLPRLLAGAWDTLLDRPAALRALRRVVAGDQRGATATLPSRTIDELLRLGGPAHAVFRHATTEVSLGAVRVGAGARVILCLAAANRDPAPFPAPERLAGTPPAGRRRGEHLAFGAGRHHCPGAPVVRLALGVATAALLAGTEDLARVADVTSDGGFAIRGPGALVVRLSHPGERTATAADPAGVDPAG